VFGWSQSDQGEGVHGACGAGTGFTYGVTGTVWSPSGSGVRGAGPRRGVYGMTSETSGWAAGVYGETGSTGGYGVIGSATAASGLTTAVYGAANSTDGRGILGVAGASSGATIGVLGRTASPTGIGVVGQSTGDAAGVVGFSGDAGDSLPAARAKTGIYGEATQDAAARGVHGYSPAGRGVFGEATSGRGVYGEATTGSGLRGYATTGTAVHASTPVDGGSGLHTGTALIADGRVKFPNCVGSIVVTAGTKSAVVTPGIDLASTSIVTATLMGNAGGTTTVQRVAVNATTNQFTIYLTANATADVKVGWHVFG
jgi:hypothetical protein